MVVWSGRGKRQDWFGARGAGTNPHDGQRGPPVENLWLPPDLRLRQLGLQRRDHPRAARGPVRVCRTCGHVPASVPSIGTLASIPMALAAGARMHSLFFGVVATLAAALSGHCQDASLPSPR
jgi:hypothetical protein